MLTIYKGDDVDQLFRLEMNSLPVDLTDIENLSCTLQNADTAEDETQTFELEPEEGDPGIVIESGDAVLGKFSLVITAAQSEALRALKQVDLDFVVTDEDGKKQTYRVPNGLTVQDRNP